MKNSYQLRIKKKVFVSSMMAEILMEQFEWENPHYFFVIDLLDLYTDKVANSS